MATSAAAVVRAEETMASLLRLGFIHIVGWAVGGWVAYGEYLDPRGGTNFLTRLRFGGGTTQK